MSVTVAEATRVRWRDASVPLALVGAAAAATIAWGASPAARYMQHGSTALVVENHVGHHGRDLGSGPAVVAGLTAAWLLMTIMTMLPTAMPLLAALRTVAGTRSRRTAEHGAIAGFLAVWTGFGFAVAVLDLQLQRVVSPSAGPLLLAATLAVAGGYQLSGMASRCLRACRHPLGFLARHWTGRPDVGRQAVAIGMAYGRSCLGCCAALMVVMFALGLGNPAWMLLFAAVTAVQKTARRGEALTKPLGIGLVVAAALVATTAAVR